MLQTVIVYLDLTEVPMGEAIGSAYQFREQNLMTSHPHDCPKCRFSGGTVPVVVLKAQNWHLCNTKEDVVWL